MTKEKNLNLKEFKSLVKKLIKEEIQKTNEKLVSEAKNKEVKATVILKESVLVYKKKLVVLEYRRKAINNMLLKEASWFDKLRGTVDPSTEVDNPAHIHKNIKSALDKANSLAGTFNKNILATSTAINAYHEAVKEALEKMSLLNGAGEQITNEYRPKIIAAARAFFKNLRSEEENLKVFKQELIADAEKNGIDKSYLVKDIQAPTPEFKVMTPKEYEGNKFVDQVINSAKGMAGAK